MESWAAALLTKLKKFITNSVAIEINSLAFSRVILKATP
jgi:hypothetical protein